eukprot:8722894-Pyramimonas_sp.AAC.2
MPALGPTDLMPRSRWEWPASGGCWLGPWPRTWPAVAPKCHVAVVGEATPKTSSLTAVDLR